MGFLIYISAKLPIGGRAYESRGRGQMCISENIADMKIPM